MDSKAHAVHHSSLSVNSQPIDIVQNPRRTGGFVLMKAFSKINLLLDVLWKRPDGYHEIKSVMQTLALHDTVTIKKAGNFQVTCTNPNLPTDDRNIVTKAAKYMMQEFEISQQVHIHIEKRIPISAGLAGGSSDCAATLTGLNALFDLNIPLRSAAHLTSLPVARSNPENTSMPLNEFINSPLAKADDVSLMKIGQRFGADVPFCLMGGTALAEGIGEKVTPLTPHPHAFVVLACPDIPVSTADIFSRYNPPLCHQSKLPGMLEALTQQNIKKIYENLSNDLTQITANIHPVINILINELKNEGAIAAAMSGSGPSVFGIFTNKITAGQAYTNIQKKAVRAFLTEIQN